MLFFDMTKLGTIDLSSTSAEKRFLATLQCENQIFHFIFPNTWILDTPPKKLRRGHLRRFWRKKMFSPKSMSNFDVVRYLSTAGSWEYCKWIEEMYWTCTVVFVSFQLMWCLAYVHCTVYNSLSCTHKENCSSVLPLVQIVNTTPPFRFQSADTHTGLDTDNCGYFSLRFSLYLP